MDRGSEKSLWFLICLLWSAVVIAAKDFSRCPPIVQSLTHYKDIHGETCYLFIDEEKFWNDARDYCWKHGGDMLEIDDEATMYFIKGVLDSKELNWNRNGVWLGAHDQPKEGHWTWASGKPMKYSYWYPGQPRSIFGISVEDCACMRRKDGWRWHDYLCGSLNWHYNFICQYPFEKGSQLEHHTGAAGAEGDSKGPIIGIVFGSAAFLLILMALLFFMYRRRQRDKPNPDDEPPRFENLSYAQLRQAEAGRSEADAVCLSANEVNSLYEEVNKRVDHGLNNYVNMAGAGAPLLLTKQENATSTETECKGNNGEKVVEKAPMKLVNNQLYEVGEEPKGNMAAATASITEPDSGKDNEEHHYEDLN